MNDLMIDIETLGTAPGSVILSIGAVEFDAHSGDFGERMYLPIKAQTCEAIGLTVDVSTVTWWMGKSDEARASATSGQLNIVEALESLSSFYAYVSPLRIWAHSPAFDLVMLEVAYKKASLQHPWIHWATRDTRTLFDVAGVKLNNTGIKHHALDDAIAQAQAVCQAYATLKTNSNTDDVTPPASSVDADTALSASEAGEVHSPDQSPASHPIPKELLVHFKDYARKSLEIAGDHAMSQDDRYEKLEGQLANYREAIPEEFWPQLDGLSKPIGAVVTGKRTVDQARSYIATDILECAATEIGG